MEFFTLFLILAATFSLFHYLKKKSNHFQNAGIPYLPSMPFFGNMGPVLFRRKHISQVVQDVYSVEPEAKYVGFSDFTKPIIMLRDLELIKSIAIKNFDDFPDHQTVFDDTDPLFSGNLVNMAGDRWREARSLLSPAFTSSKMRSMFELMHDCAKNFVDYLGKRAQSENKMVATKDLFTKYTNDVIATCAFGIGVNSLEDPNNDFYVLGKKATTFGFVETLKFLVARTFPKITKLLKIKFVDDRVGEFFKKIVKETVAMRDEKNIRRPDMIQLMMDARGKESKHLKLDITEMTAQAFIFFFGGFDTTSTQMCAIAHELAIKPDIQKKLQDEIDNVMKFTKGNPSYEDVNKMPYLDAVFNESIRYHTQGFMLDRKCIKAFELPPALPGGKPYVVNPEMIIWIPACAIHKDPKYYDEPEIFNPERYFEKKVSMNDVTHLGFGIGPRSCIGNRFAILETKILFFFLLAKFNLVPNSKTCNPLVYDRTHFGLRPPGGFWLTIESRT